MRMISIFLWILFLALLMINCNNPVESYEDRINKCLKADTTIKEFEILGTGKKGFSHSVKPECLLNVSLPKFRARTINGNLVSDENIKGKINIINFWFIKCAPCVAEIPTLNRLVEKYKIGEINFLAFTRDEPDELQVFFAKHPFDFTIIPNAEDIIKKEFHMMWGYPFTIITDRSNKIISAFNVDTPESTLAKIESLLISIK